MLSRFSSCSAPKGAIFGVFLLVAPTMAMADHHENAGEQEAASSEPLPEIGEDQLAVFVLQRGFYVSGDLGVFFTFGGAGRGYSNVQPYLSLKIGHDIGDHFGVQLSVAAGYASQNPISESNMRGAGGQETESYELLNGGLELVGAFRVAERISIEPKVGGGVTRIYPALSSPADPNVTLSSMAPHAAGGFDIKYLTLLTDFSAGISVTGYYIIGPNIPALGAGGVVRYTF